MTDEASTPLLDDADRPSSTHSRHSDEAHEHTPLLSRSDDTPRYDGSDDQGHERQASPAATSLRSIQNGRSSTKHNTDGRRWPTIAAIGVLGLIIIGIILGVFFAPVAVEEYAKEALVVEPTNLSIYGYTPTGVRVRIQANFRMDASRVKNTHVRNIGRFGTWIARAVESSESKVEVFLPEYAGILIGTATIPPVVVDIRNGKTTPIDFLADLEPGDIEGIRQVVNDWLEGRLDQIRFLGKANVGLKSGLLPLGSQTIMESMVFEGNKLPEIPKYNITRLNFKEVPLSIHGHRGMAAEATLSVFNSYPFKFMIPPLGFDILVPNCAANDPYIQLADATTGLIEINPNSDVTVEVEGIVRELPDSLLQACPNSHSSPLDLLLGNYIRGNSTTIFVRGSKAIGTGAPEWIAKIISSVTVPVPFPGHSFDDLIKNFTLTNTTFEMPDEDSGEEDPMISGNIVVIAGLPKEMNFSMNVSQVRAKADVFYKGDKLGVLNLEDWQEAHSERLESGYGDGPALKIEAQIEKAPLEITDTGTFSKILQAFLMGGKQIRLKVKALVDVRVFTVLGELTLSGLPAEGVVPMKPISTGDKFSNLMPKVGELRVLSTSKTALNLEARVNFTNPTEYAAHVPYVNIHILNNRSIIGEATVRNINIIRGNNTNVLVQATWDPTTLGGKEGAKIGRELLSQYISGFNTTLTFQTHRGSIPHQPELGEALSSLAIEIPTPSLSGPIGDGDKPHFLEDATFHMLSSTATFTINSPLQYSSIYIEDINATAFYNYTEPVGQILYDLPFKVPPGSSQSPKLPVDWSLDSVGYEALRKALGGTLELDARGEVRVRLGEWSETVWYIGAGIGAKVRF